MNKLEIIGSSELLEMIKSHKRWLEDDVLGERFDLSNKKIEDQIITKCDLTYAIFNGSSLEKVAIIDVVLDCANFVNCKLSDISFSNCRLHSITWYDHSYQENVYHQCLLSDDEAEVIFEMRNNYWPNYSGGGFP